MQNASEPTVFIVDDDAAVRRSLSRLVTSVGLPVEARKSADEFLTDFDLGRAGCLVLDVRMRGTSGLDLQDELVRRGSTLPIIFITAHADVPMAVRALQQGAVDFLEKPCRPQLLLDRIRDALEEDNVRRERRAKVADLEARVRRLTPREREVVGLVVSGLTSKEIAARLGLSPKTIHVHRAEAMSRVGAKSLAELVRIAVSAGFEPQANGNGARSDRTPPDRTQ